MLHQLLNQLRQELSLPKCLQIVTHLRHMEIFNEAELRLKFLQARNMWLQECLKNIPNNDRKFVCSYNFLNDHNCMVFIAASFHLNKTIEVTRVNLFTVVTQYRAIFNDDEHSPLASVKNQNMNHNVIFFSWISDKVISVFLVM